MPVKAGQRRGPYRREDGDDGAPSPAPYAPPVLQPTEKDLAWLERVIKNSPLVDVDTKRALAEAALIQRLLLRNFSSGRMLTVDEEKAVSSSTYELRKALFDLKLTEKVADDDEDM